MCNQKDCELLHNMCWNKGWLCWEMIHTLHFSQMVVCKVISKLTLLLNLPPLCVCVCVCVWVIYPRKMLLIWVPLCSLFKVIKLMKVEKICKCGIFVVEAFPETVRVMSNFMNCNSIMILHEYTEHFYCRTKCCRAGDITDFCSIMSCVLQAHSLMIQNAFCMMGVSEITYTCIFHTLTKMMCTQFVNPQLFFIESYASS